MAKKKWGQHFLVQTQYVDRMLELAQIQADDHIVEVGPGKGILTRALLQKEAWVTSIEVDPDLFQSLSKRVQFSEKFVGIHRDILDFSNDELLQLHSLPYKVVANLPYNIATVIFFKLLEVRSHLTSITVMVQKEVAERLCATPKDGKAYGVLAIAAEVTFARQYGFTVPPSAFSPPPRVDSAVLTLIPKAPLFDATRESRFLQWVQQIFNQRRKTLLKNLQRCSPQRFPIHQEYLTEKYGSCRAETLSPQEFIDLFQLLE